MPKYLIRMAVDNVDVFDEGLIEASVEASPILYWGSSDGIAHVRAISEAATAPQALEIVLGRLRRIAPNAKPKRILEDWVAVRDIANRVGVNRETVRLWATGDRKSGFPPPRGTVSKNVRIWDWASVNAWLRENVGLGDEHLTPTQAEVARMNEQLRYYAYQQMLPGHFAHAGAAETRERASTVQPVRWSTRAHDKRDAAEGSTRVAVRRESVAV